MIRLILVFVIVALIVRAFIIAGLMSRKGQPDSRENSHKWKFKKSVPKWLGEYVEFEELDRKKR